MIKALNNIKIKTLGTIIAVLLTVTGIIVVATSTVTIKEVSGIEDTWRDYDTVAAAKMAYLSDLRDAIGYGGMIHQFKNYVLRMDRPRIVKVQAKIREATVAMTAYRALGVNEREIAALDAIAGVVAAYADAIVTVEELASEGMSPQEIDGVVKISDKPALEGMAVLDAEMQAVRANSSASVYDAAAATLLFVKTTTAIVGALLVALIAAFIWFTRSRLIGPLTRLGVAVTKLAEGDTDVDLTVTSTDEIGEMTKSMVGLRDAVASAYERQKMIEDMPVNIITCDVKDFSINFANKATIATLKNLEHLLPVKADELVGTCIDIFHKDPEKQRRLLSDPANLPYKANITLGEEKLSLNVSALHDKAGEYVGAMLNWDVVTDQINLANSVSEIVGNVASTATEMQQAAESMASTAEETSRQSQAAAAASEQASANVQTDSAAAEEMSSSINEIARQVAQSATMAKAAVEEAQRTNETVQGLAEGSQKIGEVVEMISDIASQTNLLALNATIEAARAGEAGKGFAVVASEVKSLATQTAKATEQIASQISAIQSATDDAVGAIKGIGEKIAEMDEVTTAIASAIEEQGAATGEISSNSQQAAAGTEEVSSNIAGVNQAATETGTAAGQVLQAAGELSTHGEKLRGEVDKFLQTLNAA